MTEMTLLLGGRRLVAFLRYLHGLSNCGTSKAHRLAQQASAPWDDAHVKII
jgi:hypothetical protein